jgi:altronate dehydratase
MTSREALKISEKDTVAVALRPLDRRAFVTIGGTTLKLADNVPPYHKFALVDINRGDMVIKYGEVIGEALADISAGAHVHVHNVRSLRG